MNQPLRFGECKGFKGFVLAPVVSETFPFKGSSKIFASRIFLGAMICQFQGGSARVFVWLCICICVCCTLLGTNISPEKSIFPRWDMLVPYRVSLCKLGP